MPPAYLKITRKTTRQGQEKNKTKTKQKEQKASIEINRNFLVDVFWNGLVATGADHDEGAPEGAICRHGAPKQVELELDHKSQKASRPRRYVTTRRSTPVMEAKRPR